jgi:hypothetical protein
MSFTFPMASPLHVLCCSLFSPFKSLVIILFITCCRVLPARRTGCCTGPKFAKLVERRSQCPGLKLSPDVMTIICVYYWPAAFWPQARKTGTSAVTGSDGGLSCSAQFSSVTGAVRRHKTLLESVDSLVCHRLYYINCLKS